MKHLATLFPALLLCTFLFGQRQPDAQFVSVDTEVVMKLYRAPVAVDVSLVVNKAAQYEYIMLEKSAEPYTGFRQCRYIECRNINSDSTVQLSCRDVYPISTRQKAYYRIKTVGKDWVMRVYPPVCLPPALEKASLQ